MQAAAVEYVQTKKRKRMERLARELGMPLPELDDAAPPPEPAAALKALRAAEHTDVAAAAAMRAVAIESAHAMSTVAPLVEAEVVKQRGTALESVALDAYGDARGTAVTQRNDHMLYLRNHQYILGGRIDGWDAATHTLIEVKNRRRMWATVPEYDLIQVRVYLAMLAAKPDATPAATGLLLEKFPDGSTRETRVHHEAQAWARIHTGLVRVAQRFASVTADDVRTLITSI
jgi:hypothetical protein